MFTSVFKDRSRRRTKLHRSAEAALAHLLRSKSLRPHSFKRCEVGPFLVDHVCCARALLVELQSREIGNEAREQARTALFRELGYTVVQVSRQRVLTHPQQVIEQIRRALQR